MTARGAAGGASRRWAVAILVLLALATLRMALLVLHDPLIGVANNYDMIRVQACFDAYPDRPADVPPGSNSYNAPLPRYRFIEDVGAPCFITSEALFAAVAWPAMQLWVALGDDGTFPLRLVGVVKAALLLLLAIAFSRAWWRDGRPGWAAGNALVAALVLADPGVTVYANTFYAEFAAVFFTYAALALAALAWTRGRVGPAMAVLLAACVAFAILSKIQHVVLGVFLLAVLLVLRIAGRRAPRYMLLALSLGAAFGTGLQLWHMQSVQTQSISDANKTNTFLFAVLGQSADAAYTASVLGLPAHCADHAGKTWFSPGVAEAHPCPEATRLSRLQLIPLLWRDPGTLAAALALTLERSRAWVAPVLGKVEGGELAPLPANQPSLDPLLVALPAPVFAAWLLIPGVLAGVFLLRASQPQEDASAFVLLALGTFPWLSLVVVAFGDGLVDAAKQSHLAITTTMAFWLAIVGRVSVKAIEYQYLDGKTSSID